jgi:hypothetical protein
MAQAVCSAFSSNADNVTTSSRSIRALTKAAVPFP